jgi:uncharacterized membrane protein YdbT with pleckstrin-like domain
VNQQPQPSGDLWAGRPSQLVNVKSYALCTLQILAGMALLYWDNEIVVFLINWKASAIADHLSQIAGVLVAVAGLIMLLRYLQISSLVYHLRNGALEMESGILSRRTDVLDLYRIRDVTETRPLLMRLCGLGNIHIISTDDSTPALSLRAIRKSPQVLQLLRAEVMRSRAQNRVIVEDK